MAKEQELSVQVYDLVQSMKNHWEPITFFKTLLKIYGTADRSVEQAVLNDRAVNVASEATDDSMETADLAIRQRAYFRFLKRDEDVVPAVDKVKQLKEVQNQKNRIQFIICCSSKSLCLYDLVLNDSLSIDLDDLPDNYSFLLPIKDGRRDTIVSIQEADKKACLKLTRLLDTLAKHNSIEPNNMQKLNSFIRRILFCFFAEDTGIFNPSIENMFTNAFDKLVDKHGTNAKTFFEDLFAVLNTKNDDREAFKKERERNGHVVDATIMAFPYVNGGLFKDRGFIPEFDIATRNQLLDCGRLAWHEISPAIFGAMFQGAMKKDDRRTLGAHYTSEENILKIVKPLFLDKLYEEFEQLKRNTAPLQEKIKALPEMKRVRSSYEGITISGDFRYWSNEAIELETQRRQVFKDFLARIGKMKFLDPACGCGNFLLISYKELRKLENEVLSYIKEGLFTDSYISINQFYGIEIEDWPAEIAHVSMWLMQHLMNKEANSRFGSNIQSIPLKTSATIVTTNALTTDWNTILPADECSYVLGNPPFGGTTFTSKDQKLWLQDCYPSKYKLGLADFVTAWFVKASNYMEQNKKIESAFVATNSICQGEQVNTLWGLLFDKGIRINFAYTSFPWSNDAAGKAGVTCIIIGFSYNETNIPRLAVYNSKTKSTSLVTCKHISPYLSNCDKPVIIERQSKALSSSLNLVFGNKAADNGYFLFEYAEGQKFLLEYPEAKPFIKKFIGSSELMKSEFRYCLWLTEEKEDEWSKIPGIVSRVNKCREWRSAQTKTGDAYKLRDIPWSFRSQFNPESALVVPRVTSENRPYIPMDYIKSDFIVNDRAFMLPNATNYDFGILTSMMHMVWMKLTSGRLESRYNYSRDLTFNTFIWPNSSETQKEEITELAKQIRRIRARLQGESVSLGDMYTPDKMPEDLKVAHNNLDMAVERAYRLDPFRDDDERLSFLLDLYSDAIAKKESK
ncbi:MAG: class I SAM-dependent DNA methyltransferase [Succinivibrio sp.]